MTDPITQAAADAIVDAVYGEHLPFPPLAIAVVVVAAVTPLIQAQIADQIGGQATCNCERCESLREAARIARGGQQ